MKLFAGINDENFGFVLKNNEEFYTPECIFAYSSNGINDLTHTFHNLARNHIIRKEFAFKERPLLINSWEPFLFDFDTVKIKKLSDDAKELDKIEQLRQWAFSAAQNGDLDMAIAAISGDNVSQIKATVQKFMEIKRQHEKQMQQMEQMLKQEEIQAKLQEIAAKGEQDRLTQELKYSYEMQLKYIDVDMSMLAANSNDEGAKNRLTELAETNKHNLEQQRIQLEREKIMADTYSKAADREVKRHQIDTQLKIAKTNKNKYDK